MNKRQIQPAQIFFNWIASSVCDLVYNFLFDFTFTYLLAFNLYNEATRKSHYHRMPRCSMPEGIQYTKGSIYPTELRKYIEQLPSLSVSGLPNRAQGADFIHEEQNKLIRSFMPPRMPSGDTCVKVSRKIDRLREMKNVLVLLDSPPNYPKLVLLHMAWRGAESSLPVAHPGYQVLSDILFRLGLIAKAPTQCSA